MVNLLYQDAHLIAAHKPHGLLSVPGLSTPDNLFDRIKRQHPNARMIHRLDMATSGVILFALHHQAQRTINKQFEDKTVKKTYIALVEGKVHCKWGEVFAPMSPCPEVKTRHRITFQQGKRSHTVFERLSASDSGSRLRLHPITGRSHQLRVHCHYLGHPIAGDAFYGNPQISNRLMLHAETIAFTHPTTNRSIYLQSPCPF